MGGGDKESLNRQDAKNAKKKLLNHRGYRDQGEKITLKILFC
jgi:hypothetical protein